MQIKINNLNQQNGYVHPLTTPKNQPSFGCFRQSQRVLEAKKDYIYRVADLLNTDTRVVSKAIERSSKKRLLFLNTLAERYNKKNYYSQNKENPQLAMDIFGEIKKPGRSHFGILNSVHGSFEKLSNIFKLAKDENTLKFVQNFENNVFAHQKPSDDIIIGILKSPNRSEYIANIDKYRSYLKLNSQNGNAIKELDELIKGNKYDRVLYDRQASVENLFESFPHLQTSFEKQDIMADYSEAGKQFLEEFFGHYYIRREFDIPKSGKSKLINMLKTSTPENIKLRSDILNNFRYKFETNEADTAKEIEAMQKVFSKIDANKDVKKFVQRLMDKGLRIESIQELNHIIDVIPPKKANIFNKNVISIISKTKPGEERDIALQNEITNPFFESPSSLERLQLVRDAVLSGYMQKESRFKKIFKFVENKFNEFKYNRAVKKGLVQPIQMPIGMDVAPTKVETISAAVVNIAKETTPTVAVDIVKETAPSVVADVEKEIVPAVAVDVAKETSPLKLAIFPKNCASAKKLLVINDVKGIIEKKLHAKTLAKQENEYSKNATKIRLKLLPEIFASIKETRATDRAVGKLKSNSANKDALQLYNRINGHNRKLVRYMLLQRNVDGTRMFEVKDIISFLDKANNKVIQAKRNNPNIRSANVKAYYEHLYQAKLEQYGKLSVKKKK